MASSTDMPASSRSATSPTSAMPTAPGTGERAMSTRNNEKAINISCTAVPEAPNSHADTIRQVKLAANVPIEAARMPAPRRRTSAPSDNRSSSVNERGRIAVSIRRLRHQRDGSLRNKNRRAPSPNRPTNSNTPGQARLRPQNTADEPTSTTPATTAVVSTTEVSFITSGHASTTTGRPQVVNEGITAVATIEVATVWGDSPQRVNMCMRIAVPTAPPPSAMPYPAASADWSATTAWPSVMPGEHARRNAARATMTSAPAMSRGANPAGCTVERRSKMSAMTSRCTMLKVATMATVNTSGRYRRMRR